MSKRYAMWVPGYSVIGQTLNVDQAIQRVGGSAAYNFGGENTPAREEWFHFPIPTPVLVQDRRASLARVMILFKSDPDFGPSIHRVDVWDGGNAIGRKDLNLAGDHANGIVPDNTVDVNHDDIVWGVGVSVLVASTAGGEIRFVSVGADFDYNL